MKRTNTFKTILVCSSFLSICAFAFVNLQSNASLSSPLSAFSITRNQLESEEAEESRELSVPDVTVIGRVYDIAKRLLERSH
ncbi:MAG: hypothetical protein IT261_05450 [Saprospiraceae bacterium]|nr:hypothetical protein [Saprospiraceae bacterium]